MFDDVPTKQQSINAMHLIIWASPRLTSRGIGGHEKWFYTTKTRSMAVPSGVISNPGPLDPDFFWLKRFGLNGEFILSNTDRQTFIREIRLPVQSTPWDLQPGRIEYR